MPCRFDSDKHKLSHHRREKKKIITMGMVLCSYKAACQSYFYFFAVFPHITCVSTKGSLTFVKKA